nr:MAG TPA: hypothetical protein [Caudoviricetes sp.]
MKPCPHFIFSSYNYYIISPSFYFAIFATLTLYLSFYIFIYIFVCLFFIRKHIENH